MNSWRKRLFFQILPLGAVLLTGTRPAAFSQEGASVADSASAKAMSLKATVRRVDLDVVVTDQKGHAVGGLTRDDFQVKEDDAPETLRFFDVHTVAPVVEAGLKLPMLPPNTFLNASSEPDSDAPTVILYDALNTPLGDQLDAHREMLKLLRSRRPGTPLAIFILLDKLHLLQGFTEDTSLLAAALASKQGAPQTTTLLAPGSGIAGTPLSGSSGNGEALPANAAFDLALAKAREFDDLNQLQLQDKRVEITLDALARIGRFLAPLPGRKNVIWLSSGFPVDMLPLPQTPTRSDLHDRDMRDYSVQLKQATDLLNLSRVSVYPVDARGVRVNRDLSAANNAAYGANPAFGGPAAMLQNRSTSALATTSTSLNLSQEEFIEGDVANRETMDLLADQTGGHAFYGMNGLQNAVNTALLDGSTYYSLTYEPTNPKYDGSLRHIKVALKNPGYDLAYRRSYYADDLNAVARAAADAPVSPLTPALERGTPLDHGLFVEAHLEAAGAPVPATPDQMRVLAQYAALQSRADRETRKTSAPMPPAPMMQQYLITYALVARQLEMPASDTGIRKASLEFGVVAYGEDGIKLNGLDTRIDDPISPDRYAKLLDGGYRVQQPIWVPVATTTLRLAVRDVAANRTGSLEIPLPLAPTPPASATSAPAPRPPGHAR